MRWFLVSVFLLLTACEDESRLIGVDGFMWHFAFSEDGRYLITVHGHPEKNEYGVFSGGIFPDTIRVLEVGTWKEKMRYTSGFQVFRVFTCADPDIIIHSEYESTRDELNDLVFRRISTGEEVARLDVDELPYAPPEGQSYYCDMDNNVAYMEIFGDRVTALNGSTGEVLKEYLAEDLGGYTSFYVQKDKDRLVRVDKYEDFIWIFKLSSGELLGSVDLWPYYRSEYATTGHEFVDDDHVLYAVEGEKDGNDGLHMMLFDLNDRAIEREYFLGNIELGSFLVSMEPGSRQVLVSILDLEKHCGRLWIFDLDTEELTLGLDMCFLGKGGVSILIPELDLVVLGDWRHPSGAEAYYYAYNYPDFALIGEWPSPSAYEVRMYVPSRKIVVAESYFNDHFGIYDPVNARVVDDFEACNGLASHSMRVDPTERWAAVMCSGIWPDEIDSEKDKPKGAGVAVVDLDEYK